MATFKGEIYKIINARYRRKYKACLNIIPQKFDSVKTAVAPLGHKISDDWKYDENNHWRTCTVCNEVLTETQMAHEMNGEKCTTCNYDGSKSDNTLSNPTETTPDSTAPQQQEKGNGGMPWWSLLLIGLGAVGFGIAFVFVKLKKKDSMRNEL